MNKVETKEFQKNAVPAGQSELPCYTVLDLFSGIGGFSLGLERTGGFKTIAFCEIEEFPRKILRKHWPDVPIFKDVRKLHAKDLPKTVDVICGGYPCQPFSFAGKRRGAEDDRHLWPEIVRLIRELAAAGNKPTWCLFENVAGHISMGLDQVLYDLEGENYTSWPLVIPACALNAPHRRDRVWIIANSNGPRSQAAWAEQQTTGIKQHGELGRKVSPHPGSAGRKERNPAAKPSNTGHTSGGDNQVVFADHNGQRKLQPERSKQDLGRWFSNCREWTTECPVRGRDDGLPENVARLKALGNAVVPQIPEIIGRAILSV